MELRLLLPWPYIHRGAWSHPHLKLVWHKTINMVECLGQALIADEQNPELTASGCGYQNEPALIVAVDL